MSLQDYWRTPDKNDIIIATPTHFIDYKYIYEHPKISDELVRIGINKGEKSTWSKMTQIKIRCEIEFFLEEHLWDLSPLEVPFGRQSLEELILKVT